MWDLIQNTTEPSFSCVLNSFDKALPSRKRTSIRVLLLEFTVEFSEVSDMMLASLVSLKEIKI